MRYSGIPFSAMKSGTWKIIVSGDQIAVQRTITLTVGIPQTSTVIVSGVDKLNGKISSEGTYR